MSATCQGRVSQKAGSIPVILPAISLLEGFKTKEQWTSSRIFQEAYYYLFEEPGDSDDDEETMSDPSPTDGTSMTRHDELNNSIHQAARECPIYVQSALHLARECRTLVSCYSRWLAGQRVNDPQDLERLEELEEAVAGKLNHLIADEVLTRDLKRILELLQFFGGQDPEYFQDSDLFPGVFRYAFDYLVLTRQFVIYPDEVRISAKEGLERGIKYDQSELLNPPQPEDLILPLELSSTQYAQGPCT